jgi:hypothetical protein
MGRCSSNRPVQHTRTYDHVRSSSLYWFNELGYEARVVLTVSIYGDHYIGFQFACSLKATPNGASITEILTVTNHVCTELFRDKRGVILAAVIDNHDAVHVLLRLHNNLGYLAFFIKGRNARDHSPPAPHQHIPSERANKEPVEQIAFELY